MIWITKPERDFCLLSNILISFFRGTGTNKGNKTLLKDCQYDEDWDMIILNLILIENPWSEMGKLNNFPEKGNKSWPVKSRVEYKMTQTSVLNWFESWVLLAHTK